MSFGPRTGIALLLSAAALLAATAGLASGDDDEPRPARVGSMNLSRVFGESKGMKRLQAEIEMVYGARIRSLTERRAALEARAAAMSKTGPEGGARELLKELARVTEEIQQVNQAVDQRKLVYLKQFEPKLRKAARSACTAKGIDLLLSNADLDLNAARSASALAGAMSDRKVWFASANVIDLTDAVLERLGED